MRSNFEKKRYNKGLKRKNKIQRGLKQNPEMNLNSDGIPLKKSSRS